MIQPNVCKKPSDWARSAKPGERLYRFYWFGELSWVTGTVELRIPSDGNARLTFARKRITVSRSDVDRFEAALNLSGFASMPTDEPLAGGSCLDGTDVTIEAVVEGRYHGVRRNCKAAPLWPAIQILMDLAQIKSLDGRTDS